MKRLAVTETELIQLADKLGFHEGVRLQEAVLPGPEAGILWLQPMDRYPVYLRETYMLTTNPAQFGRRRWERQGGDLVAVAIAHKSCSSRSVYYRRVWWTKNYDAYHGYYLSRREMIAGDGMYVFGKEAPAEARDAASIAPNKKSTPPRGTYNRALLQPRKERKRS